MNNYTKENPPVFPSPITNDGKGDVHRLHESLHAEEMFFCGMTLRDYFAAKAMQAFLEMQTWVSMKPESASKLIAQASYMMAEKMLEARAK